MENNAYKENKIEINGKEIVIPEILTYGQIINCESKGLTIVDVQKKPFFAVAVIFSEIQKITVKEAIAVLDKAFSEGVQISDLINQILPSYTNFFARNSNKR